MNWSNVLIGVCFYISLPILYVVMRNASLEKNHLILSVTIPPEGRDDSEVKAVCRKFRKRMACVFWTLTLVLVPALFLPWISVLTTVCLVWLIAAIALPYAIFAKSNAEMKTIKRLRGWQSGSARRTVAALPPAKQHKRLRTVWFLPPMVVSLLPLLSVFLDGWDASWKMVLAITAGSCFLVTALSLVFYPLVFRQRMDALDEDMELTVVLTRVRRYNWTKFWLLSAWFTAAYSLAVWCCQGNMAWYLVWTFLYSLVLIAASLQTEFAARRAQRRLTIGRAEPSAVDEDDRWLFGLVYYNPDDARVFVNERVGIGMAMNLAKPAVKWTMCACVVLLLAMPFLGVWLMFEEFSPIELRTEGRTVVSSQAFTTYRVALDDVQDAELLEKLPQAHRVAGTAMERLLKGKFTMEGYGAVELCLDPESPPFLLLETQDGVYCFSGAQAESIYKTAVEP